jgi:hypothetical protein
MNLQLAMQFLKPGRLFYVYNPIALQPSLVLIKVSFSATIFV